MIKPTMIAHSILGLLVRVLQRNYRAMTFLGLWAKCLRTGPDGKSVNSLEGPLVTKAGTLPHILTFKLD
jgi:hypothetical protein